MEIRFFLANGSKLKFQLSSEHNTTSPRPKKSRVAKSQLKVMLIAFFDNEGLLIHREFMPNGRTVNSGVDI